MKNESIAIANPSQTHAPRAAFELNQRVLHAQHGYGTIRGFIQPRTDEIIWLVHFDAAPTIPTPAGAIPISQLFPVATRDLRVI
jgi:hypothetical protein